MKKFSKYLVLSLCIALLIYFLGPQPNTPHYTVDLPEIPSSKSLDDVLKGIENQHKIKADNQAQIIWKDSLKKERTPYAIVYLHGFSASHEEGNPVHRQLAKSIQANLLLTRLADHGLDTISPMQHFSAEKLWKSAQLAYALGKQLGDKVILVGTSTGGTLALKLAATYPEVHSLILLSPNIAINDNKAWLLNYPWGLQIARKVTGGLERKIEGKSAEYKKYWYTNYRLESVVQLQELVETTMIPEVFQSVKQPVLLLYYYKNEKEQDPVVKVDAMLQMFEELGTAKAFKQKIALPNTGNHVIGSYITSKDVPSVESAIQNFIPVIEAYKNKP